MKHRRTKKALVIFLIAFCSLVLLLFILFNLPVGHRFITARVNSILKSAGVPVHITSINRILPKSLSIQGVSLSGPENDTIIYAGKIDAEFVLSALLGKRIIITSVYLEDASVNIQRGRKDLNIAEAFAGKNADTIPKPESAKKKWEFSIGMAEISGLNFRMNDSIGGIKINQKIADLKIEVSNMSLPEHIIQIRSLTLDGSAGNIKISSDSEKKDTTAGVSWDLGLEQLALSNINLGFNNIPGKQLIAIRLGKAQVDIRRMDLKNKIIDAGDISLLQTSIIFKTGSSEENIAKPVEKSKPGTFPWNIEARGIDLENVNFSMGNYGDTATYFGITNLLLNFSDLKLNKEEYTLDIRRTVFDMDNGLSVTGLKGNIESRSGYTSLKLSAETSNSRLNIECRADGNLMDLLSDPKKMRKAAVSVSNTQLSIKDFLYFKPDLKDKPAVKVLEKSPLIFQARVTLLDSVINIPEIKIEKDQIGITLSGNINNAFIEGRQSGKMEVDLPDINIASLNSILKESGIIMALPEIDSVSLSASVSGTLKSADFQASISSDIGKTDIAGNISYSDDNFYVKTVFQDILTGKLLKNQMLGSLDGRVEIKGSGIRKKNLSADIIAMIDTLYFNGYAYTKARLDCKISDQNYNVNVIIDDPSLKCNLDVLLNTADTVLDARAEGSYYAQLNKLNLFKDTLEIDGKIRAGFKKNHNMIESELNVLETKFVTPYDNSVLPDINIVFISDSIRTKLNAESDFFKAKVSIEKPVSELNHILKAYKDYAGTFIGPAYMDRSARVSFLPEMKADISIRPHKAIWMILNDTSFHFSDFKLNLLNNPALEELNYKINARSFKYKSIKIGSFNASLTDSAGKMNILTSTDSLTIFSHRISKIIIDSHFSNMEGITKFSVFENPGSRMYDFEFSSKLDSSGIDLKIPSEQLTMNGVKWIMDSPELMSYDHVTKSFEVSLKMHTPQSFINITSDRSAGLHTNYVMKNVDIASLLPTALINGNPAGIISGTVDVSSKSDHTREIHADMNLKDVSWSDLDYRNLALNINFNSDTTQAFTADMKADIDSAGIIAKVSSKANGDRNLDAEFANLPIEDVQPFVKKFLSDLKGYISGNMKINSSGKAKELDGEIRFDGASVRVKTLNSIFKIPSDKITFNGDKIIFDSFTVLDSLNNELLVDGFLEFGQSGAMSDLEIISKNLQVMGSQEIDNPTFFGNIFVDSHLTIRGPLSSPALKGNIMLAGGTEIFFKEKENLNLTETEKVMTFVKPASQKNDNAEVKNSFNTRTSVDALVKIDPETKIHFQVSKRLFNIDLMIQGGGELKYDLLANKAITLAGKYEISDGTTDVKMTGWPNKAFTITKGGYIRWDGKLDDPELNFQAVNKVHSSYTNPVDNKQRNADFNVTLKLANRLSALDLLFTITTPDQYLMSIINTLSPEEQMRQAITILLFAKIDLPGISTSSNYMTEQVNQLVASQLNQLTKTTISGIDISFGVDSYVQATESGGQETKTSLSYELKKELLNKRAQIEVSGRLNDVNKQPGASDLSLNNVSFEYRLDSAGTKFLKVYNEHTYEDVFEGEVVKTGIGLTYRKNYPTLKDIWRKKNKKTESVTK